jgi:hypothetical protein
MRSRGGDGGGVVCGHSSRIQRRELQGRGIAIRDALGLKLVTPT